MDTGSHLLIGATLAGLAYLNPAVAANPELGHAVLAVAMTGSHAPDFDTLMRVKGYRYYLKFHRGISHSLPALLVWPALISLPVAFGFGVMEFLPFLYAWTMLAVMLHVLLDWLNAYGVQCFRPLNKRWHHLDILPLFDPLLFTLHGAGLLAWIWGAASPGAIFTGVYTASLLYILMRVHYHERMLRQVKEAFSSSDAYIQLVPGLMWFHGQFILEKEDAYCTGTIHKNQISLKNTYRKEHTHPAALATMEAAGVKTFLHLSQRAHVDIMEEQDGFLVQWRDVRFWYDNKLPFGVDVKLDGNMQVLREQLYWNKKLWDPPYI